MIRALAVMALVILAACQTTTSPYLAEGAEQRFVAIDNGAALMAIVQGRTVEYTNASNRGSGITQTFNSNGTTVYGNQKRVWSIVNGKYCSSAELESSPDTWECFAISVNEAGNVIRWQRYPDAKQLSAPAGEVDTWYGRIR